VIGSAIVTTSGIGSATSRQLNFTISRQFGIQGTVLLTISMYYDQVISTIFKISIIILDNTQLPGVMYVPATSLITFSDGEQQQSLSFPIVVDAFLSLGAVFNITITNATLTDSSGTERPYIVVCYYL